MSVHPYIEQAARLNVTPLAADATPEERAQRARYITEREADFTDALGGDVDRATRQAHAIKKPQEGGKGWTAELLNTTQGLNSRYNPINAGLTMLKTIWAHFCRFYMPDQPHIAGNLFDELDNQEKFAPEIGTPITTTKRGLDGQDVQRQFTNAGAAPDMVAAIAPAPDIKPSA